VQCQHEFVGVMLRGEREEMRYEFEGPKVVSWMTAARERCAILLET
jgi:hypothetical protein